MVSFLDKLKGKFKKEKKKAKPASKKEVIDEIDFDERLKGVVQVDVDICQTSSEIIIYALIPGAKIEDIDVSIGNDYDVLTIEGKRKRPDPELVGNEAEWLHQECQWGGFFRQIILPEQINASKIKAQLKKEGILILRLPLLSKKPSRKKVKIT